MPLNIIMNWSRDNVGSRASFRERMLTEELNRIRSTYSFNLGLLLTEALFRKPWKILLLPFTFMALNLKYLRERKIRTFDEIKSSLKLNKDCLLLVCTNEEGVASAERIATIAHEWNLSLIHI